MPRARLAAALLAAAVAAGACTLDQAELLRPGTPIVDAEPGQLRVLTYRVDPDAGDDWIDVLDPDPAVVTEGDPFLEDESRVADEDEPADRRRLFTAVAVGRTLLVELNCRQCDGGVPGTPVDETGIHVWDFVVGSTDQEFTDDTTIAREGDNERSIGEYLVVVGDEPLELEVEHDGDGPPPIRLVGHHTPRDDVGIDVAVFVAVAPGSASVGPYDVTVA